MFKVTNGSTGNETRFDKLEDAIKFAINQNSISFIEDGTREDLLRIDSIDTARVTIKPTDLGVLVGLKDLDLCGRLLTIVSPPARTQSRQSIGSGAVFNGDARFGNITQTS
jgi:hypothetical protein